METRIRLRSQDIEEAIVDYLQKHSGLNVPSSLKLEYDTSNSRELRTLPNNLAIYASWDTIKETKKSGFKIISVADDRVHFKCSCGNVHEGKVDSTNSWFCSGCKATFTNAEILAAIQQWRQGSSLKNLAELVLKNCRNCKSPLNKAYIVTYLRNMSNLYNVKYTEEELDAEVLRIMKEVNK